MKNYCYLVYDYEKQTPAACVDTLDELSAFLGTTKAVASSELCRIKKGIIKYVRDKSGHKYQTYKIELEA